MAHEAQLSRVIAGYEASPEAFSACDIESLRDFVIDESIVITDERGNAFDVVMTSALVSLYESVAKRRFYRQPDHNIPDPCPACDGTGVTPRLLPSGADIPTCIVCKGNGLDPAIADEWPCPDCGTLEGPATDHSADTCPKRAQA